MYSFNGFNVSDGMFRSYPYPNIAHVYHSANRKSLDKNYEPCYCVSQLFNRLTGERYPNYTYDDNLNHPKTYVKETNKKIKIKDRSTHCCNKVINQSVDACGVQSDFVNRGQPICYDWNEIPETQEYNFYPGKKHKFKDSCTYMKSKKNNKNTFDDMPDIEDYKCKNLFNYTQEDNNIDEGAIDSLNRNTELYTNNLESRSLGSTGTPVKRKDKSKLKFWVKKDRDLANYYNKGDAYFPETKDSFAATVEDDTETYDVYCGNKHKQPCIPLDTPDMYSCKCCPMQNEQNDYLLDYRTPMKTSQGTNNIYQEVNKPVSTYIESLGQQNVNLKKNINKQKIRCSSACCPKEKIKRRNAICCSPVGDPCSLRRSHNEQNQNNSCSNCCPNVYEKNTNEQFNCTLTCCPKKQNHEILTCSDKCCPKNAITKQKKKKKIRCDSVCCPEEKVQLEKCHTISNNNERLDILNIQEKRHDGNNNYICPELLNNRNNLHVEKNMKSNFDCECRDENLAIRNNYVRDKQDPRKTLRVDTIMKCNFDGECRDENLPIRNNCIKEYRKDNHINCDCLPELIENMRLNKDCCNPICRLSNKRQKNAVTDNIISMKGKQAVKNPFTDNRDQKCYGDNINKVSSENTVKFKKVGKRLSQLFGFKNKRIDKRYVDMAGGDINDNKIIKPELRNNKAQKNIPKPTQDKACLCANVTCECAKEIKKLKERLKETKKILKRKRRKEKFNRKRARELDKLNKKMEKRREKWRRKAEKRRLKRHLDSIKATRAAKVQELKMLSSNVHDPNTNFMKDVIGGIMKLGCVAINNTISVFTKSVRDPKGTIRKVKRAARDPSNTIADIKATMDDPYSTWSLTKRKIRKSMNASPHMNVLSDEFQNTAIYSVFASKAKTEQEIKNRQMNAKMRKRRIRKRNDEAIYGCRHILLTTLRKTPCLWIYHICPAVYPQFVSILMFWKNFFNILLMLLAVVVWTPCIAFFECFRAILCCFFC